MLDKRAAAAALLFLLAGAGVVAWLAPPWLRERRIRANQTEALKGLILLRGARSGETKDIEGLGVPGFTEAIPRLGYRYRALPLRDEAERFSICAYPAVYGETGLLTYCATGLGLFRKDTGGVCPDRSPPRQGWGIID